jgi:quercetin dioxygenase-like cupin family protein
MRRFFFLVVAVIALSAALLIAQDAAAPATPSGDHVVVKASDLKWTPGPPGLPAGAMMCVLTGDPTKNTPFTVRAKLPAGMVIAPHWHPIDENITVLSGKMNIGHGDKVDKASATALNPGDFTRMPARMHHFAFFDDETIIQLHGRGPFDINYINPADDPRKKEPGH